MLCAHGFVEKCHIYSDSSFLNTLERHRDVKVSYHRYASFFLFSDSEKMQDIVNVLFEDHYLWIQINSLERNSYNLSVLKEALKKTECGERCRIH